LEHLVRADFPAHNPVLAALASVHQASNRLSPLPVAERSWSQGQEMQLKRDAAAAAANLRAYFPDLLSALRCHQDVVWGLGPGPLLRYVSGYVSKFSDAFHREWLEGAPAGWSLAERVLSSYQPLEPQMWLALSRVPLVRHTGKGRKVHVPDPAGERDTAEHEAYMACARRSESMTFYRWLHVLRYHNGASTVYEWVRRLHARLPQPRPSLRRFLNEVPLSGQMLVGCLM
jgi:hypothetical protein